MTIHEKAIMLNKSVSKILHNKISLKKYDLLPCRVYNNRIEIKVYGNKDRLKQVEDILQNEFNMIIRVDEKYPSIKYYRIDDIHLLIM